MVGFQAWTVPAPHPAPEYPPFLTIVPMCYVAQVSVHTPFLFLPVALPGKLLTKDQFLVSVGLAHLYFCVTALFTVAKIRKQPNCPRTDDGTKKYGMLLGYKYKVEIMHFVICRRI